jgi:DNA-binding FadR family transcriptional regulator
MINELSPVLKFIADATRQDEPIPSISELSSQLGISTASVREQLEVPKELGFVEVRTRTGIQKHEFCLTRPLTLSMTYGLRVDPELFQEYASVRRQLEIAYWYEACALLEKSHIEELRRLEELANWKINQSPVVIPTAEHRNFHLAIYRPLNNRVRNSVLETYWDLYEASRIQYYRNHEYLESVWSYHRQMLDAITSKAYEKGYEALVTHFDLIKTFKKADLRQRFE